jgi:hypothetical protein
MQIAAEQNKQTLGGTTRRGHTRDPFAAGNRGNQPLGVTVGLQIGYGKVGAKPIELLPFHHTNHSNASIVFSASLSAAVRSDAGVLVLLFHAVMLKHMWSGLMK